MCYFLQFYFRELNLFNRHVLNLPNNNRWMCNLRFFYVSVPFKAKGRKCKTDIERTQGNQNVSCELR